MASDRNTKPIWVALVNNDEPAFTGALRAIAVSSSVTAVTRFGKGKNAKGSDAVIMERTAYYINNEWYYPVEISLQPTTDDREMDDLLERAQVIEQRLRWAGVSEADLEVYARAKALP